VAVAPSYTVGRLPSFQKRFKWFMRNRPEMAHNVSEIEDPAFPGKPRRMLAIPSRERLVRMLRYMLDENEFLSPHGIRSLSRFHKDQPFTLHWDCEDLKVDYSPGDSTTGLFGGNSNWRGPIWFPINHLLIEALEQYYHFYRDTLLVECPTGSGNMMDLCQVAKEIERRLASIFLPGPDGTRPYAASLGRFANDPLWRNNILFNEYFHGDNGRGIGADHQTGWTALIADCLRSLAAK